MNKKKISIVIPCYNEQDNIEKSVRYMKDYKMFKLGMQKSVFNWSQWANPPLKFDGCPPDNGGQLDISPADIPQNQQSAKNDKDNK